MLSNQASQEQDVSGLVPSHGINTILDLYSGRSDYLIGTL